jgi:hypothetical protein
LDFSNQSVPIYPTVETDPAKGVTHYFYQVQGGRHTTIAPDGDAEAAFAKPAWMQ